MFGSRENGRKGEKMEQQKKKRENSCPAAVYSAKRKIKNRSTRFQLSLFSAQISKNTKIPSVPIIHEGKNGKNHKKEVKLEVNGAKKKQENARHFCTSAIFRTLQNFRTLLRSSRFSSFFCSSFLLFLICNAEFDSNSTCLDRLDNFGINSLQKLQN